MAPGDYVLSVRHDEYQSLRRPLSIRDGRAPAELELVLERGARVTGVVETERGEPAAAALVSAPGQRPPKTAIADSRGRFLLAGLTPGEVSLVADSRGLSSAPRQIALSPSEEVGPIRLTIGDHSIRGEVVDGSGEPVAGATVRAAVPRDERALPGALVGAVDVTGAEGTFELSPLLPATRYELFAVAPEVPESYLFLEDLPPELAESGDDRVRLVVPEPGQIVGEVALEGGGAPEEFAVSVAAHRLGLPGSPSTPFSATGGSFALAAVPPGTYAVSIMAAGQKPAILEPVSVEAGRPTDLGQVLLESGAEISGRVVDGDGAPVAGARVFISDFLAGGARRIHTPSAWADEGGDPYLSGYAPLRVAISGGAGRFSAANVYSRSGRLVEIADHPARGRSVASVFAVSDRSAGTLVLRRPGSIEGSVAGAEGSVEVWASPLLEHDPGRSGPDSSPVQFMVRADRQGRYRFDRLAPGLYELHPVEVEAMYDPAAASGRRVEVSPGGESRRDL